MSMYTLSALFALCMQYRDMMMSPDYSYDGSREWPGIVRKLKRHAPDFNT
jgi:hypothetical protein